MYWTLDIDMTFLRKCIANVPFNYSIMHFKIAHSSLNMVPYLMKQLLCL